MRVKIYTKTGDAGETGLFGGGRVPKDHRRVEAYGEVDELNAAIGLARALEPSGFGDGLLQSIQRDLFTIGAELATPDRDKRSEEHTSELQSLAYLVCRLLLEKKNLFTTIKRETSAGIFSDH